PSSPHPPSAETKSLASSTLDHSASSRCESDASLNGVVALQSDFEAVLLCVDPVAVGLANERRRAWDRRKDAVMERRRLARCSLERLQPRLDCSADLEGSLRAFDVEGDRHLLDSQALLHELRDVRDAPADPRGPRV